jgi:ligand-binding sensor domain-containing protein
VGLSPAPTPVSEAPTVKPAGWHRFGAWRQAEGLAQDSVFVIIQTRDGYLWMGTKGGIVRFDGVRFTTFDDRGGNLGDNEVWTMAEARDGSLWVGTYGGGVSRYKDGAFTVFTTGQGLAGNYVGYVATGHGDDIWFGTDRGLSRFHDGALTSFTTKDGLPGNVVRSIYADADGSVWIGTNSGGIARYVGGKIESVTYEGPAFKSEIRWFWRAPDQTMWIGTYEGVARLKDGHLDLYTTAHGLSANRTRQITPDGTTGALWIVNDRGLDRMTMGPEGPTFTNAVPIVDLTAFCVDHEGSLWLGSGVEGLSRYRQGVFSTYTPEEGGLPDYYVSAVIQDRRGRVWAGTRSSVARLDSHGVTSYREADGLPGSTVFALLEDRQDRLWVGTSQGLYRRERERFVPITVPGHQRPYIRMLFEDHNGVIWLGLDQQGVIRLDGDQATTYTMAEGLGDNAVRGIAEDHDGTLWVATRGGGLSRFDGSRFTTFTVKDGLAANGVQSLFLDVEGVLWISTRQGLSRRKDGRFTSYTVAKGLPTSYIYAMIDDGHGFMWLSSGLGIFRIARKDFDDLDAGKIPALRSEAYGLSHGLQCTQGVAGSNPAITRTYDGHLWFGMQNGLSVVDPRATASNTLAPAIHLEDVVVDGKSRDRRGPLSLSPGQGDVRFRYTGLSFIAPEKMKFRYRLEGYDPDWIEAETRRDAYYTNIPPGHYVFRVVACNNDGVWNRTGASIALTLAPHFYQTYWFYALCIGGVALAGAGSQRLRVRALQARERELSARVEQAVAQVKQLSGLLPICASCKKIRDDKGYWNQMETYIHDHSGADFSHSVCPDCLAKLYPDYAAAQSNQPS